MIPWAYISHSPNGISIGLAVLQGSRTWPTDTHTDIPCYSVCSIRPHLCYACSAA